MGNPYEEDYFFEGYRDYGQGEPRPMDVLTNPAPMSDKDELCRRLQACVFFVKRPAYVEPPFFAKPLLKIKNNMQVAGGATGVVFDRLIEDRQRAVVTAFGLDVAPLAPLFNGQLEFWFQSANAQGITAQKGTIIPLFDDQTPTQYGGVTPVRSGRTTVLPASVENPWCLLSNGLQFGVRGRSRLQMLVENKSGAPVTIRGVLAFYYYWSAAQAGAAEWASGDLQL